MIRLCWQNAFECPVCRGREYSEGMTRRLFQCSGCCHQVSLAAGTIFASTYLSLRLWFRAMYHRNQSKRGIASIGLGCCLDVRAEIDDAYPGGERDGGKRGRGAPGKTPFVETAPERKHGAIKTGPAPTAAHTPTANLVNTALGNVESAIAGTYRSIHEKHVPRYLAGIACRFSRRHAPAPHLSWPPDPSHALPPVQAC